MIIPHLRQLALRVKRSFPRSRERRQEFRRETLVEIFTTVNLFLRELDVEFWLTDGTLLGYFREGNILKHDNDVDFGANEASYERIWNNRGRLPSGFRMYDTSERHRGPKLYIAYKQLEADIYFYEEKADTLRSYTIESTPNYSQSFPKRFIYPLQKSDFYGEDTFVPNETKSYLEHVYGYIGHDAVRDSVTGYWRKK